jgi:hypothetical protein
VGPYSNVNSIADFFSGIYLQLNGVQYAFGNINHVTGTPETCTITKVDSVAISGTFSGTVFLGNATKTSFYVPF